MTGNTKHRRRTPFPVVVGGLLLLAAAIVAVRWPSEAAGPVASKSSTRATSSSAPTPSAPTPPACRYGNRPAEQDDYDDWARTLVDTDRRLPSTYAPPDLVSVEEAGFDRGVLVRSFLIPDLEALREAADAAGHPIDVVAAYRSYQQQAALFERRERELGRAAALGRTARPGHSEHQLGTTVDFKTFGQVDVDPSWGSTPTGAWVLANAYRFGFVESYPPNSADVTCYAVEPWHLRYFGRDTAERIRDSGLTVREYLWRQEDGD